MSINLSEMEFSSYPLGYLALSESNHVDTQPDLTVNEFWNEFEGRNPSGTGWYTPSINFKTLVKRILRYAYEKFEPFGGFKKFSTKNIDDANLSLNAARFLIDTERFIATGKRRIMIESWEYLLEYSEEYKESVTKPVNQGLALKDETPDGFLSDDDDKQMLAKWVAHPGGLRDLVWTLKILFGDNKLS